MNFCHDCQLARSIPRGIVCSVRHRVTWKWPNDAHDLSYGFHAKHGCEKSFQPRREGYYQMPKDTGKEAA